MSKALLIEPASRAKDRYTATAESKYGPRPARSKIIEGVISAKTFLNTLRAARPDQRLVFELNQSVLVAPGYHVTEVKAVSYDTMDCGGVANNWLETIIQLWNPRDEPAPEHMTVRKFLAIYDRVAKHVPISHDAELRFEYGDAGQPALSYHIQSIEASGDLILVNLKAPVVSCKARDQKNIDTETKANCCG